MKIEGKNRAKPPGISLAAKPAASKLAFWLLLAHFLSPVATVVAETEPALPTITDPALVVGLPNEVKSLAHPLRLEGRVDYYDPGFRIFWFGHHNEGVYLQLGANPPVMRTGQHVVIEGKLTPNKGLSADDVSVRVVEEDAPFTALDTNGRINDFDAWHARVVTVEGYVDSQQNVDDHHVRLILIIENRPVICWIDPDNPTQIPNWQGRIVRATGVYSRRFDPTRTKATVEIWLGRQKDLQVTGLLEASARFNRSVTPLDALYHTPLGTEVLVRGTIEARQPGISMTVRDTTGQVEIRTIQQQRFPLGTEVEAVGQVAFTSGQWLLDAALYRPVPVAAAGSQPAAPADAGALTSVAQIRALGAEEAAQGRPVDVTGMVTWSLPESPFLFLQDLTGGVRVYFDKAKTGDIRYGKYFRVKGVTRAGQIAPAMELRELTDLGSMSHPPAKLITYEQALTGREDGEWVELRGFLQRTVSEGDWRWIHVTTPAGPFVGHLQNPENFVANPGSLIRIHGVCETTIDPDNQSKGITLRVPFVHDITIEEDAPADYYDLPRTPLGDLEQISTGQNIRRVRVTGTVQSAIPGRLVYLEQDAKGVLLLTPNQEPLQPGDQIEAVGILGREGARTLLREAVLRKTGSVPPPKPLEIEDAKQLVPEADARLVRLRGTLIDVAVFDRLGQTRLTLQQGNTLFEAMLEQSAGAPQLEQSLGAGLELTGIYQLKYDDARQARSFQLLLRTPDDVAVYMKPRLWTLQRALIVVAVLGGCVLLGLTWIRSLRRRVQEQTTLIRSQMENQARLEAEVQRAARLESLGVLAGGIAHDYNNLLTIIMGNLSLMKLTPQIMSLEGGRVDEIETASLRARDLTRQLLTFAEGGDPLRAVLDLSAVVREAAELVLRGTAIPYDFEVGRDLWPAYIDRDQISQVVQNLVRNAQEAMSGGGNLRLLLANAEIRNGFHPNLKPGRYVRVTIIDTGEGIAPEVLPRIFDPYFSTKQGGGGLGLATVYSIIKKHEGHIEAQSKPGQGASFTLWLPVAEAAAENKALPAAPGIAARGAPEAAQPAPAAAVAANAAPLRVLLMDDEESILRLGTILLQRMGLEATAVTNGASAVREFEAAFRSSRPFALIVLDLTIMGGMGGKETIELIRKTDTNVPAIVSSGYSRDPVMAHYQAFGFQAVIPKPYDIKRFKETVQNLLQPKARAA